MWDLLVKNTQFLKTRERKHLKFRLDSTIHHKKTHKLVKWLRAGMQHTHHHQNSAIDHAPDCCCCYCCCWCSGSAMSERKHFASEPNFLSFLFCLGQTWFALSTWKKVKNQTLILKNDATWNIIFLNNLFRKKIKSIRRAKVNFSQCSI